jgi:hypothetical protein
MIHHYTINGLEVQTGDLICTTDGDDTDITGKLWRLIGKLMPGEVDLNTGMGIPHLPLTKSIIFPEEIWNGCVHRNPL